MASAACEISSCVSAHNFVGPSAAPPTAAVITVINSRRVGTLVNAFELFLSAIVSLLYFVRDRTHQTTSPKYVQDNLLPGNRRPFEAYFSASRTRSPHALPLRSSPGREESHHRQRSQTV